MGIKLKIIVTLLVFAFIFVPVFAFLFNLQGMPFKQGIKLTSIAYGIAIALISLLLYLTP